MTQPSQELSFRERRDSTAAPPSLERRQFANSHEELSPRARELAMSIDQYKVRHRRRFITYEEILSVIEELGYSKG